MNFLLGWHRGTWPEYQRCIADSHRLYREAFRESAITSERQLNLSEAATLTANVFIIRAAGDKAAE